MMQCRICGGRENNAVYRAREMQLGWRDEFDYFQCAACDCLQIAEIPQDIHRYYPPGYFEPLKLGKVIVPKWALTMWFVPDILAASRNSRTPQNPLGARNEGLSAVLAEKAVACYLPKLAERRDARIL